jgi:hypothetical protein
MNYGTNFGMGKPKKKKINVTCEDSAGCGGKDDSGCEKTKERE